MGLLDVMNNRLLEVVPDVGRHTGLWLPYILVTVCTDIVTVRIRIAYSNCTAILAHGFNSCGNVTPS
jgi:hypothetical protein